MQTQNTPPQLQLQAEISSLQVELNDYQQIIQSKAAKVTIIFTGKKDQEIINKVLLITPGSLPLYNFFIERIIEIESQLKQFSQTN